jgi:hypothetical protein
MTEPPPSELERLDGQEQVGGVWSEIGTFLWLNKSWWLMPIVLMLGVLGVLVALAGSAAAPFIYTLF